MSTVPPTDTGLDRATDPEYAAVSPVAVFGLIISVLGISAFVAVPLLAAPVVGVILSAVARVRVRRSAGVLTGRWLATAGLVLGVAFTGTATGWHIYRHVSERLELEALAERTEEITDLLLEGRYGEVYALLPEDFRARPGVSERGFAAAMRQMFEGGGELVERKLLALRIAEGERGELLAPAEVQVRFERRILAVRFGFTRAGGEWTLLGVRAEPTFASRMEFGPIMPHRPPLPDEPPATGRSFPPAAVPAPEESTPPQEPPTALEGP